MMMKRHLLWNSWSTTSSLLPRQLCLLPKQTSLFPRQLQNRITVPLVMQDQKVPIRMEMRKIWTPHLSNLLPEQIWRPFAQNMHKANVLYYQWFIMMKGNLLWCKGNVFLFVEKWWCCWDLKKEIKWVCATCMKEVEGHSWYCNGPLWCHYCNGPLWCHLHCGIADSTMSYFCIALWKQNQITFGT